MFARFTTVAGERGAADAERDIRGFALKFYTEEGNWDMVGNKTPVFFLRDPRKFPDLNKAVKRDPRTNMRSATNNWDFWTLLPEALHQVTIVMSDRGIPASYRHMHGFGSHTYSFWNEAGERFWVKFHFRSRQGIKNLTNEEAAKIIANDRESHQRDLYEAIERGEFPKWTMYIQVMPEADAEKVPYHPFDLTKVWPKKDYPLIEVGEFELNRNPENFFADVEQSAFAPSNLVPGIGASRVEDVGVGLGVLGGLSGLLIGGLEDRVVGDLRRVGNELVEGVGGSREDDGAAVVRPGVLVLSVGDPLGELHGQRGVLRGDRDTDVLTLKDWLDARVGRERADAGVLVDRLVVLLD